tara:strand:- start:682 stop:1752 length:1071 start_codon:yes stop_codon:yes gene_type:complete
MKIGILDFRVLRRFNPFSKHYDKVVSSNTNGTDSTAEHGAIPEGDDRYNGGVYANGHIYFIPWSADNVYKINVVTKVVSLAVTIVLPSKAYASGVLAPNGKIYCIPFSASDILVINPTDDSFYTIPVDAGTLKWQCGSINEDGVIYCIPRTNANVLKIDTRDDTFSLLPHTTGTWFSSTLTQDGIIYGIPWSDTNILKIDTKTDTITEFGGIAGTAKWAGAVLVGHYIYGIPYRSTTVLKIDIRDDSFTTFGVVSSDNDKWFDGALLENGFIYGCPSSAGAILKINPADDTLSSFGSFPTIQTWRGITNGGNGSLYCAVNGLLGQNNTSQTLEITNDGVVNFISEEFIKSAYYNKL